MDNTSFEKKKVNYNAYRIENIWKFERLLKELEPKIHKLQGFEKKNAIKRFGLFRAELENLRNWEFYGY